MLPGATRRDYLKGYLLSILAEGAFEGLASPAAIGKKAAALFATDLPAVLTEMGQVFAGQAGHNISSAILGHVGDIVNDISKRGVKAVWSDVLAQYQRGVEVKHGPVGSRKP
jgi:hypothetical protein